MSVYILYPAGKQTTKEHVESHLHTSCGWKKTTMADLEVLGWAEQAQVEVQELASSVEVP